MQRYANYLARAEQKDMRVFQYFTFAYFAVFTNSNVQMLNTKLFNIFTENFTQNKAEYYRMIWPKQSSC